MMTIHIIPKELWKKIYSCLGIKDLYRCKCVCRTWNKMIRTEMMIIEIFLRLPVQSLLGFKSVSRYCYNLISDMNFVRLHHNYQARLNPAVLVMDRDSMYCALLNPKVLVLPDSSIYNDYGITQLFLPEKIGSEDICTRLVGCCNGLICYYHLQFHGRTTDKFFLYNPATSAYSLVPPYAGNSYTSGRVAGFGYDSTDKGHKIVVFETNENAVLIYSLRSRSWRKVNTSYPLGSAPCIFRGMVFVNNGFHWIFDKGRIMSFELAGEQYHELPTPKLKASIVGGILLSAPDGSNLHLLQQRWARMDLWIMKEYGVKYSWNKLFSISDDGFDLRQFSKPLPVAYVKGTSQILIGSTEKPHEAVDFMIYDFKTRTLKKLRILDGLPIGFRARDPFELPNVRVPVTSARWAESLFPLN